MNPTAKAAAAAILLATILTLSHALMRAAASHSPFGMDWLIRMGTALALYAAVFFFYSFLLRTLALSVLYPTYTSLSMVGVFLVGAIYFNESITAQKLMGLAAVLVGVVLLSRG